MKDVKTDKDKYADVDKYARVKKSEYPGNANNDICP